MNIKKILIYTILLSSLLLPAAEKLPKIICAIYGNYTIKPDNDAALAAFEQKFLIPMKKSGFNTVDLKLHDFTRSPELFQKNLKKIAETVNKHGMQLCIYTYFPIVRKSNSPFPAAVDGNGRLQNRFYNILAPGLWHDLLKSARRIAELSKDIPIMAVKIDFEEMFLKGYITPFNDDVWHGFQKINNFGEVAPQNRGSFLEKKGLIAAYETYIENCLAQEAKRFREEIQAINPSLHLGMMPADNKALYNAFMRELGTEKNPAIIDIWNLYNGSGFTRDVTSSINHVKKMNASNMAVSWLRFNVCKPKNLAGHLYHSAMAGNGWNGWEMEMLSADQSKLSPMFRLPKGEKADSYWKAFQEVNTAIAADIAEKNTVYEKIQLKALLPLLPELKIENFSSPVPVCIGKGNRKIAKWFTVRTRQAFFFASTDGMPTQIEIKHLAGNKRPNGIAYAVLDKSGKVLRRESVMPGETAQFQIVLPELGTGKLIVEGGDGGMAWYAVRITSTHFSLPANKAYFFYRSPVDFVTSGSGNLHFFSEANQIFNLNVDGKWTRVEGKKAIIVPKGKHKISFRSPKNVPRGYYTQDLHLKTVDGDVWISDSPDRQMDVIEKR